MWGWTRLSSTRFKNATLTKKRTANETTDVNALTHMCFGTVHLNQSICLSAQLLVHCLGFYFVFPQGQVTQPALPQFLLLCLVRVLPERDQFTQLWLNTCTRYIVRSKCKNKKQTKQNRKYNDTSNNHLNAHADKQHCQ